MFEPTEGCPHLQPLELMAMAEKTWKESGESQSRESSKVKVIEFTPKHMFKAIETTLSFNGQAWMVSHVDRHLSSDGLTQGCSLA
jgi:hypothetical protein